MKFSELTPEQYQSLSERGMVGDGGLPPNLYSCPGKTAPAEHGPETVEECEVIDGAPYVSATDKDTCPEHGLKFGEDEHGERALVGTRLV